MYNIISIGFFLNVCAVRVSSSTIETPFDNRLPLSHPCYLPSTIMSYTKMYMVAMVPNGGSLPSIGSATETASPTDDISFMDFIWRIPEAESIHATFGEGTCSYYVDRLIKDCELKTARAAKTEEGKSNLTKNPTTRPSKLWKW